MFQTSESCIKLHAVVVLELLLSEQCVCVSTSGVCVCPLQVCVCVSVSVGRDKQAIRHFWSGLRIFERINCVRLQQKVIDLYIFENLFIMMNVRWIDISGAVE